MSENQSSVRHPEYWTTLSEYHQDEDFLSRAGEEFYPEAKPERFFEAEGDQNALMTPVQRRTFLKMSGFAALAATLAACERPEQKVLPYVNRPEEIKLGHPNYYASTCTECASGCGLLVKTREGRPIKLEGNPDHPINRGALCSKGQGSIMSLYDPDRLRFPVRVGALGEYKFDESFRMTNADMEIGQAIRSARGKVVLLTRTLNGPSDLRLVREFVGQGENFEHVVYDPIFTGEIRSAHEASFGEAVMPRYRFERADVVLCLGGDPLAQSTSPVEIQKGFAAKRIPTAAGMSRVYVFEPTPTLTGMNADYRYPTRPDHLLLVGLAIAHQLILVDGRSNLGGDSNVRGLLQQYTPASVAQTTGIAAEEILRVAKSLGDAQGRSIVYTQGAAAQTADAYSLHLLANFLNAALGNYAETIDITVSPSRQAQGGAGEILQLIEEMRSGAISVLIFHDVNPAYTLPASTGFADAVRNVPMVASLNLRMDETAALAKIAVPAVHGLESWGDAEAQQGLYSIQQPAINVLFGESAKNPYYATRAWQESVMAFVTAAGRDTFMRQAAAVEGQEAPAPQRASWYDYVRETWERDVFPAANAGGGFENFWIYTVQLGVLDTVGDERRNGALAAPSFRSAAVGGIAVTAQGTNLQFLAQPTIHHGDGRSMGNPFLLEIPDPVSTVCWENYAAVAPAYAEANGIKEGEHVTVGVGDRSITIPAFIQPGQHPEVVAVSLGWGRQSFGAIGDGIGVNAYPLTEVTNGAPRYSGLPVTIEKSTGKTRLASTQGHNYLYSPEHAGVMVNKRKFQPGESVPEGAETSEGGKAVYARPIIADTTFNEWSKDAYHAYPNHLEPGRDIPDSMWEARHKYVGHHWGMTIDLNACNGCGACMVACHIENNVPVVGKDEIIKGREMFWIRIDRYYRGDKENPEFAKMPLLCQHCDNAPCETVCPVIATLHNDEGLNVMTYNRCVGTRYCANNCPYKVRRFNFWQYSDYRTGPYNDVKRISPLEMVLNPEVTTRTKGVMEKCTFCLQRIRASKENVRAQGRKLEDEDLQVACQQTCPAKAIVFGDRNNPDSEVAHQWSDPRGYGLLADLTTDPSIRYKAVVRNRDEPSPYRTKYQDHRQHHEHAHHEGEGDDHHQDDHQSEQHH